MSTLYRPSQEEIANARAVKDKFAAQDAARVQTYETKIGKRAESEAKQRVKAKQKWRQVGESGKALVDEAARGYDGLVQALLAQCNCDKLSAAMRASMPVTWMLGKVFLPIADFLGCRMDETWDAAGNTLGSLLGYEHEFKLPHLQYYLELNDDGTLAVHSLKDNLVIADDAAFTPEQKEDMDADFEEGVVDWIEAVEGGKYVLQPVPGTDAFKVVEKSTGVALDQAAFRVLRDDPDHGFNAELQRRFDIKFEQIEPIQRPSASPR